MKKIEIFRPGKHTANSGEELAFSEDHLKQTAEAYDPAVHEAPIVVGHPRNDAPAYGWVSGLAFSEGSLEAEPDQVDPQFAEIVRQGKYKKISAAFYRPNSKSNPKPGVYYLRHVGFLGAQPPVVKGLKPVSFGEADEDLVEIEFAESERRLSRVLRSIREFVIEFAGIRKANEVVPEYEIRELETAGEEAPAAEYAEGKEGKTLSVEEKERQKIRQEVEAEFAEREQKLAEQERKRRRQAHEQAVDALVNEGKVLPRHKDGLVAFMEAVDGGDSQVEFAEGEGGEKKPLAPVDWLQKFLSELPQSVDYSERGGGEGDEDIAAYDAPEGFSVDAEKARLHAQALEYQEQNDVDYVTAVNAVAKKKGGK